MNGANAWYLADFTSSNKTQDVWNESADVSAGSSETIVLYNSPGTGAVGQTVEFTSGGAVLSGDYSALFPGDTVRVIYNNPDSDKSATLAKYEVQ